jgi:curved DNA-binding protein CbpA
MEANVNLEVLLKENRWEHYTDRIRKAGIKDISDLSCSEPSYLISLGIPPLIAKTLICLSKGQNSNISSNQPSWTECSNQSANSNVIHSNGDIPSEILDVRSIDIYSPCGLSITSSEEEINRKWKELITKNHPDKNSKTDSKTDSKTTQDFLRFFKILRDPNLRKLYNIYYKPKVSFEDTENGLDKLKKEISEAISRQEDILLWKREKNTIEQQRKKLEEQQRKIEKKLSKLNSENRKKERLLVQITHEKGDKEYRENHYPICTEENNCLENLKIYFPDFSRSRFYFERQYGMDSLLGYLRNRYPELKTKKFKLVKFQFIDEDLKSEIK